MKLGVDLSSYLELEAYKPKYKYNGKEIELFSFFAKHSKIDTVRLRLWVNPYDEQGIPYGGGTNDTKTVLELAKKAKENNMNVLLDFHYSDFWTDPSRQILPKAWRCLDLEGVIDALYNYTKDTLLEFKKANIDVIGVQIGNEITHGICYPFGEIYREFDEKTGGTFQGLSMLLRAGIKASKEVFPNAKTIIHLEHSGSTEMQDNFLTNLQKHEVNFDVLGESYYPYWHGGFPKLKENIKHINEKYGYEIWMVECGYDFFKSESTEPLFHEIKPNEIIVGDINGRIPFPHTKAGQADFLKELLRVSKELNIERVFYWEPAWIYLDGNGWASNEGQRFCGLEPVEPVNAWTTSALFEMDGSANPAIDIFSQDVVDKL